MSTRLPSSRRSAAGIPVPPECRETIRRGALVAVSTSGGKDSQAMTILLSRIVPRDQLIAVHAPLREVEWPGTIEHIEATLPHGVPLILAPVASATTALAAATGLSRIVAYRLLADLEACGSIHSAMERVNERATRLWWRGS